MRKYLKGQKWHDARNKDKVPPPNFLGSNLPSPFSQFTQATEVEVGLSVVVTVRKHQVLLEITPNRR